MNRHRQRGGFVGSIAGILACGGTAGFVAWLAVNAMNLEGVAGAVAAAAIGMVVATALWIAGTTLLRALGMLQ